MVSTPLHSASEYARGDALPCCDYRGFVRMSAEYSEALDGGHLAVCLARRMVFAQRLLDGSASVFATRRRTTCMQKRPSVQGGISAGSPVRKLADRCGGLG